MREGRLSRAQAEEITKAAAKDPDAERELLELAEQKDLKGLKDRARQVRHRAASRQDEATRFRQIAQRRALRSWSDPEGALCLQVRLTPDAGARVLAVIDAEADAVFEEARREGRRESYEAYRADAFVRLLTGTGGSEGGRRPKARDQVLVLVDAEALVRGWVGRAERCELAGVGSVSAASVRRIMGGEHADVNIVMTKAKDVVSVCRLGRLISPEQRIAITVRDDGRCQVPGCGATKNLEAHHWNEPFAVCGTTSLDNLVLVCPRHHDLITYEGWALEGGPGHWQFRGPPEAPPERIFDTG